MTSIAAIILAAGQSSRMKGNKALAPWVSGKSIILHQIDTLSSAGFYPVVVVLGHNHEPIIKEISKRNVEITINLQYDQGRSSSIIAGVKTLSSGLSGVLIISVDQPRTVVIPAYLREKWASSDALIASPSYGNKNGHPILFDSILIP